MQVELSKGRIAWACAAAIAASAWMLPNLRAQFGGGGGAGGMGGQMQAGGAEAGGADDGDPPRIYYKAPMSAEAAATWMKLGKKAPMLFQNETPLEEFLGYIKKATSDKKEVAGDKKENTADKKDVPAEADSVMIYVDPVGLQEAEKSMASPITLNLANIKIETALKLALKQLDLCFDVTPEGLVIITSNTSKDSELDADALILDKLDALRAEVRQLRGMIGSKK